MVELQRVLLTKVELKQQLLTTTELKKFAKQRKQQRISPTMMELQKVLETFKSAKFIV